MDAGGLAQMTYSNLPAAGTLGVPGSGYASKGKGSHIKHLSMPPAPVPQTFSPTDGGMASATTSAPRTSRSHLLAGLRTAPKTTGPPPSAPPAQLHHFDGLDDGRHAAGQHHVALPQTAVASAFPSQASDLHPSLNPMNAARQMYSLPEQVLAPPAINLGGGPGEEQIDPNLYAELFATNLYLAQQQQRLQQQLINVTAAAQQFQGLTVNPQTGYRADQLHRFGSSPPGSSFHAAPPRGGMPPGSSSVGGSPASLFPGYGLPNGSPGYLVDHPPQRSPYPPAPPGVEMDPTSALPPTPQFRAQVSPPPRGHLDSSAAVPRHASPPKAIVSPAQAASPSLPPPSANAFRRGHKKATSMVSSLTGSTATATSAKDLASPLGPKSAGFPQTPLTGTFGPGQGRAGEHPIRQPRGPPPLEELIANPTSKHDGGKNFATRRRRRAVHSLVRAGIERRGGRGNASAGSPGSMTPASEAEITFSASSDNDSEGVGGGARSRRPSLGSIRAAANGAIGSERKDRRGHSRGRDSVDGVYTAASLSSDDGASVGGPLVEVKADGLATTKQKPKVVDERRKAPMLVLSSAAKRKSSMF